MSSIYGDIILDNYNFPRNNHALTKPTDTVHVDNPLCGDMLDMAVQIQNKKIKDIGFTGEGCAISIASASLLTEYAKGKTIDSLRTIDPDFMIRLVHIELSPNRLKCALLSWEALKQIISNY